MQLPIRNYTSKPLTVFIEPECEQYELPPGHEAVVVLEDGRPHSLDVFDGQISVWNESAEPAIVEIRPPRFSAP